MKQLIALVMALGMTTAYAESHIEKVCHPDPKTKKEVCKNVKVHKKVEGTPVPEKAPTPAKKKK